MISARPRILYVTRHPPHAGRTGGQYRTLHICRLLQQIGDLGIILLTIGEDEEPSLAETKSEFTVEAVLRLKPQSNRDFRSRLNHEFNPWFLGTQGFAPSQADRARIAELMAQYDMVWVHGIWSANCAGLGRCPNSVLDVDDILSGYYRSEMASADSCRKRLRAARQWWLWKRRESVFLDRFNVLAVCSEADRRHFGASERVHAIANGFESPDGEPERTPTDPPRIGFIGNLNFVPNRDGIEWFIASVWPLIKAAHPHARLRLVGSGTEKGITQLGPDVDGLGWVADTSSEMATWSLMAVPIRLGAGTRIKIVEGFSRKCPVVSTTLGAFGREVTSGEELLLADSPAEFAQACSSVLRNPALGIELANRAWEKFQALWTWQAVKPRVETVVEQCLSLSRRATSHRSPATHPCREGVADA